jgi:hypothetical protein
MSDDPIIDKLKNVLFNQINNQRETSFDQFIALKRIEYDRAVELGHIDRYSFDPDYKNEILYVDVYFTPEEPVDYISLNFVSQSNIRYTDILSNLNEHENK